jgi:AraC-like DNA-binding protein
MHFARTPELIADGNDDLVLGLSQDARQRVSHLGRECVTDADTAVLMSLSDPSEATAAHLSRCTTISVPRKALLGAVPKLEDNLARELPRNSEAFQLLKSYIGILDGRQEISTPELWRAVVNHVHDLLALALGASRDAAEIANHRGVRAARLHSLKQDIRNNMNSPGFSLEDIARQHGITPRYVQKLFEREGVTFSQYLRDQRLARVHRLLGEPRLAGRKIASIVFDAGFGDLSHFNREFRRRYGESPSDVRAAAQQKDKRSFRTD